MRDRFSSKTTEVSPGLKVRSNTSFVSINIRGANCSLRDYKRFLSGLRLHLGNDYCRLQTTKIGFSEPAQTCGGGRNYRKKTVFVVCSRHHTTTGSRDVFLNGFLNGFLNDFLNDFLDDFLRDFLIFLNECLIDIH